MFEIISILFIAVILIAIVISISIYSDKKKEYIDIKLYGIKRCGDKMYFSIPYYIWETKKFYMAKKNYPQNKIIHNDKTEFKYVITSCNSEFVPENKNSPFNLIQRELWFWVEPANVIESRMHKSHIYQNINNNYGTANVAERDIFSINNTSNLNNMHDIINLISEIKKHIEENKDIDEEHKEEVLDDLEVIQEQIKSEKPKYIKLKKAYMGIKNFITKIPKSIATATLITSELNKLVESIQMILDKIKG